MSSIITTSETQELDLFVTPGDTYEGGHILHLDENQGELNLTNATVTAEIRDAAGTLVVSPEVEVVDPATDGDIRFWMTAAQTALLTQTVPRSAIDEGCPADVSALSPYHYTVRVSYPELAANLASLDATGKFTASTQHFIALTDTVLFLNTGEASINGNQYTPTSIDSTTEFTIDSITGITNSDLGGGVYTYRTNTSLVGAVVAYGQG